MGRMKGDTKRDRQTQRKQPYDQKRSKKERKQKEKEGVDWAAGALFYDIVNSV
jgi:hypothetical protein